MALKFITAEEAASFVHHDDNVGFSGFTPAGCPKVVPGAIAKKAIAEHEKGNPFQIGMFTGASTGDKLDGELARANAIKFRTPYQSNKDLRALLNSHGAQYFDMHLSELAQSLRYGFLGKIDVAIVEAADVTEDGEIVPTSGVGILPTICRMADRIIIELNCRHPKEIRGMHDIYEPADPPYRREIPIYTPSDRIGSDCVKVDPAKIVGVVKTDEPNEGGKFSPLDDVTMAIGQNVANFLVGEIKAGRLPKEFVPLQSGVGNVANAVLGCMGENKDIPAFNVYTEVIQDAVIALMKEGRVKFASGCSLSVSNEVIRDIYANLDFFKDKILLRPQEISNNPEVARRLGPIMTFVGNLGYVAVAVLGSVLAVNGTIEVGDIQAFIQYVKNFTQPITQIAQVSNMLQSAAAAAERVFEFLDEEEEEQTVEHPVSMDQLTGAVSFEHVRFGYTPDKIVIQDFSCEVNPGQMVAIVGPTGAGKTTMVKLLMRFYDVNSGRICLDGHDIRNFNRGQLREMFGMVLQDTWLFQGTIMENIRYGRLDATDEEVIAAAKAAHADHFIRTPLYDESEFL